jgi:hypothetical protein
MLCFYRPLHCMHQFQYFEHCNQASPCGGSWRNPVIGSFDSCFRGSPDFIQAKVEILDLLSDRPK